ncbi:MAG TPA: adenylate/guanylate cyclase domain-containing protein [Spirochaetota bacterium]|nr:adenylate/guanylate cyclase domain-containing protein [Spirochaetota bacterium]
MNTTLPLIKKTIYLETVDGSGAKDIPFDADFGGIAVALIFSSKPVKAGQYNALVRRLESRGLTVVSHHIENTDPHALGPVRAAVRDINAALTLGDCLVVSFGESHALTVLLCHLLKTGLPLEDAIHTVRETRNDPLFLDEDLSFLLEFQKMPGRKADFPAEYERFRTDYSIELKPLAQGLPKIEGLSGPAILDAIAVRGPQADAGTSRPETGDDAPSKPLVTELPDPYEFQLERFIDEDRAAYPEISAESTLYDEAFIVEQPALPEPETLATEERIPSEGAAEAAPRAGAPETIPEMSAEAVSGEETLPRPGRRARAGAGGKAVAQTGSFYASLRFKLISIISLVITLSLSGMIFLATYFFKEDNKLRVEENNHKISEVVALKAQGDIETLIKRAELVAGKIAGAPAAAALAGEPYIIHAAIARRGQGGPAFVFAGTARNTALMGRLQLTAESLETALKGTGGNIVRSFNGETVIQNVSPLVNLPLLALGVPLERDASGRVGSVLACLVSPENLMKAFQSRGGITTVFMINEAGDVIAHPDTSIVVSGGNFIELPIVKMMMTSKIDNGQTRYRDEKRVFHIGSFRKVSTGGLGVIATVEERKAFEEVYNIQRRNIYIMVIVLTVVVLIIFYFGNTITTPIIDLVWATKKIKEGDYRVDILPTTRDEIGELTASFIEMGRGLEEREKIKSAFGKFVNKDIAEAAMRGSLALGGERKTVAILFTDIRSFTSISEKLQPEEVVEFLNQYLTRMVECVNLTNGVVDKFIGDAIMAVWGTPVSRGNDTEDAINSALLMRKSLVEFNSDRGSPGKPVINIGCGVNTGLVLAGQIGSDDRMEYTIIGDAVNLASRIESLTRPLGTDILISEDSYELVKGVFSVVPMQAIKVKGKEKPQRIYAVMGRLDDPGRPASVEELRAHAGIITPPETAGQALEELPAGSELKYEIVEH